MTDQIAKGKYAERLDELLAAYGGRGKLNEKSHGYEFVFDDSKEDMISWNGDDFVGVNRGTLKFTSP